MTTGRDFLERFETWYWGLFIRIIYPQEKAMRNFFLVSNSSRKMLKYWWIAFELLLQIEEGSFLPLHLQSSRAKQECFSCNRNVIGSVWWIQLKKLLLLKAVTGTLGLLLVLFYCVTIFSTRICTRLRNLHEDRNDDRHAQVAVLTSEFNRNLA